MSDGEQTPHEPDYRMSLAAERTFLAYIRTGLALLAAGVGVVVAAPSTDHSTQEVRRVIGVALLVIGGVVLGAARPRWAAVDRAMRQGQPLPEAHIARLLGPLLVLIAAGAIAVVVRA